MVIIGLYGSTPPRRGRIADRVARSRLARLVAYKMDTPCKPSQRAERMGHVMTDVVATRLDGIVFADVRSYEEADAIRQRGGVLWFVEGSPSSDIAIQRGDIAVTDTEGGHRHYLDPLEALSETLFRSARGCHG